MFFGVDKTGKTVMLSVNQTYSFKQSYSVVHIKDHAGFEFTHEGWCIFKILCVVT